MVKAVQLKKGNVIIWRDALWKIADIQQTFTGKHGAYYQMRLQSVDDGHVESNRFASDENVERAFVETSRMEYLYQDGQNYVFMDGRTGEQMSIHASALGDAVQYLPYNAEVEIQTHEGRPIAVNLPANVVLEVVEAPPAVRGDTATTVTRPVTTETGLQVKAPGHVKKGDRIQVDTRSGEFLGRA